MLIVCIWNHHHPPTPTKKKQNFSILLSIHLFLLNKNLKSFGEMDASCFIEYSVLLFLFVSQCVCVYNWLFNYFFLFIFVSPELLFIFVFHHNDYCKHIFIYSMYKWYRRPKWTLINFSTFASRHQFKFIVFGPHRSVSLFSYLQKKTELPTHIRFINEKNSIPSNELKWNVTTSHIVS